MRSFSAISLMCAFMAAMAPSAFAEATDQDVAGILYSVNHQATGFDGGNFLHMAIMLAFGLGVLLTARGLLKMKEAADNPNQTKFGSPLSNLGVGAMLASFAATVNAVTNTMGLTRATMTTADAEGFEGIGGRLRDGPESGVGALLSGDPVAAALENGWLLFVGLGVAVGVTLIAVGLHKMKEAGEGNHQVKGSQGLSYAAIGGSMVSLPTLVQAFVATTGLSASPPDAIAISAEVDYGLWESISRGMQHLEPLNILLIAIGMVGGMKLVLTGLSKLKEATEGRVKASAGLTYMLFGSTLMVVPGVMSAMQATFGLPAGVEPEAPGWASQGSDLTEGIRVASGHLLSNLTLMIYLVSAIATVVGVLRIIKGLGILAQSADNGSEGNQKLKPKYGILQLVVGGALGALFPAAVRVQETVGWDKVGDAFSLATSGEAGAVDNGLGSLLNYFQAAQAIWLLYGVMAVAFIGGFALIAIGLNGLKDADLGDTASGPTKPLMQLLSGAGLMGIAAFMPAAAQTFGLSGEINIATSAAGEASCSGGGWQCAVAGFASNAAGPLTTATLAVAVIVGAVLIASALFGFAKIGGQGGQREQVGGLLAKLVVGAILVNAFQFTDGLLSQSFGLLGAGDAVNSFSAKASQCSSAIAYKEGAPQMTEDQLKALLSVCFITLYPFGLIAAIRGLLMMKDHADGNKQVGIGHAGTFMFGGTALMNAHAVSLLTAQTLSPGSKMIETLKGMSDGGFSC